MGASFDGDGVNFAVFSAHAERVELCLFSQDGRRELCRLPLRERDGDIWHIHVGGLPPGTIYGYRVHGPYVPEQGHRFNPNKLLLDPYARALEGFDANLPRFLAPLRPGDLAIFTADHGNDPTWRGTDHTRERVPVLCAGVGRGALGLPPPGFAAGEERLPPLATPSR